MVIDICDICNNYAGTAFEKAINRIAHYIFGKETGVLFLKNLKFRNTW